MKQYYVYILSSYRRVLYIGVTSDLIKKVYEHKNNLIEGFSSKYRTKNLVYYEITSDVKSALSREKQLKNWRREKKEMLIAKMNPEWKDLYNTIIWIPRLGPMGLARNDRGLLCFVFLTSLLPSPPTLQCL